MQLKASDLVKTTSDGNAILVRLGRRDVLAWIADANPISLVLYYAAQDRAYWLSIHSYFAAPHLFAKLRGQTVTVSMPTANRINAKAMREFASVKAAILAPQGEEP